MSPPHIAPVPAAYAPVSDAMDRHDAGVSKNRKAASTGGGRAWSEDEEVYLLQTRLQKMPYKHIAAHLKKTELACRLHYHQLSHGSNRRKRTASCSSGSDASPVMPPSIPSPIRESKSRSMSPPGSSGSYAPVAPNHAVQLPSIMSADASPKLPAILPKPASMDMAHHRGSSPYPTPGAEQRHGSLPPPSSYRPHQPATPPLRLDCSALPPPSTLTHSAGHIDLNRLHHIYSSHRNTFWAAIANDYGSHASPAALEHAWRTGICCNTTATHRGGSPITPVSSPDNHAAEREAYLRAQDKTRIASILAFDGPDPRSACDRDMVRRMDEQRFSSLPTTA